MLLTNKRVMASQDAMTKMLNTNLPVKQAYHIKKTLEGIKKQVEFVSDQRVELIKKHGIAKDNEIFEVPEENKADFFKDFGELLELEEDIDVRQLTLDDLDRIELTANELDTIDFMIKIEE